MKHLFVLNPAAGGVKGRVAEILSEITRTAQELDDPYEIYETKGPMDASLRIAGEADALRGGELRVYACGGDGTLNECVNGAAERPNVAVTHYPRGTGNDFLKTFGQENVPLFRDLRALTLGKARPLDLINCSGRYSINICSVGIDARVARDVHKYSGIPLIGGATGYVTSLLVNVVKGVGRRFRIKCGEYDSDARITLACACSGRFYGGGFNPVPDAMPDDGILDFLIINSVSRLKVAGIVGKYAKGKAREFGDLVTYVRGGSMEIEGEGEFVVNIDGEIIAARSVSLEIVPGGINFIFPEDLDYHKSLIP